MRDETACWAAVVNRDVRADGRFVYSVSTTGVYCRPSCPSRQARRDHVRFHPTCAEAERAGFRPCLRCHPDRPSMVDRRSAVVVAACRMLDRTESTIRVAAVARAVGLSPFHFQRVFKAATGLTPGAYAAARRATRVRTTLTRAATITDAIYDSGFGSSGRFYEAATSIIGMTPRAYRAGAKDEAILFGTAPCALGIVLVAATAKGVCAILLGDDRDALVGDLLRRFSRARLVEADVQLADRLSAVVGVVESPGQELELPLDIRGTAFQQRVWQELRRIPSGSTRSYGEIAAEIGASGSARAVARACASNPLALAVPCHRVVSATGDLTGYRWGVERKRALLERERR